MATYFHVNSEIQAGDGGMQTLYLMNPNYVPYSDTITSIPNNTLLLNPVNLSHAPPQPSNDNVHEHHQHPLLGIPLPAAQPSEDNNNINRASSFHHYDLWSSIDTHMASLAAASAAANNPSPLGLSRPVASVPNRQQGLSLSLSSSQQVPAYNNNRPISIEGNNYHHNNTEGRRGQVTVVSPGELMRVSESSPSSVSVVSNGISGMQSGIMGSNNKYLRAVQELLDEVVKVENIIDYSVVEDENNREKMTKLNNRESKMAGGVDHEEEPNGTTGESSKKSPFELTTAQRQELQIKKTKLVNMLDEVEQRYKQYHHQMQLVASAFEQAAGSGSAKSYTAVALRTISKQFRCLKDAISGQLKATSKRLGENNDCCLGAKVESSRLRFVDQIHQQQRAFQHLGMMQHHHAWRPQRGLPERAVIILRAWLFEHFLHPYPKDSDKQQLAKQTGLTRSQVSNWFINARVRLWKPMVEEMYLEEVKEKERNGYDENASKTESKESPHHQLEQIKALEAKAEKSTTQMASSPTELSNSILLSTPPMGGTFQQKPGFHLIGPSDIEGFVQRRQNKKQRNNAEMLNSPSSILSMDIGMKQGETSREIGRERLSINDRGGGFGSYSLGADFGRFNPDHHHHHQLAAPMFHGNNGVSLTLGLPHSENLSLSGTQHHNLLSGQNIGQLGSSSEPEFCPESTGYESIDIQNRKRFATQLLPDFVT